MRRVLLALAVAALGATVASCAPTPEPRPRPTEKPTSTSVPTQVPTAEAVSLDGPSCPDSFEEAEVITREIDLASGQTLTISLGSTPSIPCGWRAPEISETEVVTQTEHQSVWPAEGVTPMPGAPGTEVWAFKALKEGRAELSLICACLDEGGDEFLVEGRYVMRVGVDE
jgi:predicted secreted protein